MTEEEYMRMIESGMMPGMSPQYRQMAGVPGQPMPPMPQAPQEPQGFKQRLQGLLGTGFDDPRSQGLLGLGAALLQASGPSTMPISTGQALGQGVQAYMGSRNSAANQGIQNDYIKAKTSAARLFPGGDPSGAMKNWGMRQQLVRQFGEGSPEVLKFDNYVRANQVLNLGDTQMITGVGGATVASHKVNLKPGDQPSVRGAQAEAAAAGKDTAEKKSELADFEANLPRLEVVAKELSDLGKKATYTTTGQALDIARREAGMPARESAVARKEYISKVDNEILPLLRLTFGAQFTEREGQSLKATLGDPNATPEEKDAVLRSFIDTKRAQIETQRRKLGLPPGDAKKPPKTITRTGTLNGRKVNQYSDGSVEYAD